MADNTPIEWADATWNPITGCRVLSPGCTNCYAMRLAGGRLRGLPSRAGLTDDSKAGPVWNGEVKFNEDWLDQPLRWRRPRRIFVCAHGDLLYEEVPDEWIDRVLEVMALAPQHVFIVLTKRAERMRNYLTALDTINRIAGRVEKARTDDRPVGPLPHLDPGARWWPLPNVWLGVSVEDQARADERIPLLLDTPAAGRFISAEPLLGPVDLSELPFPEGLSGTVNALTWETSTFGNSIEVHASASRFAAGLDWVLAGGEIGRGARPMHPAWARSLRDQCQAAGVPFFFKQWGEWAPGDHGKADADDCALLGDNGVSAYAARGTWPSELATLALMQRVGKHAAGRLLDGREWSEFPA